MGNRIRELRAERGLTLANLANNTGLAPNTISQYETGKRNPKLETWIKLANYFGVPVSYLQGIEDKAGPTSELEHQKAHDAVWDAVGKLVRAASVGTMSYEEAYKELKRYRNKSDELRYKEKQETQQRMFDLALSTFKRRERNEK
ncbi:helix-turn-helix domain-containing protein [uncultured Ligilactobacillus sp.]|uniref:helix-turn-helix domain-containing protein n=2 Tax=uncultured Ligilactobacillus sp. TaxID=2837633 RepID=UPI00272998C5|nr:helix-turn-helix transcriptional regulator [uncultured Ligilactobacillus sp.]